MNCQSDSAAAASNTPAPTTAVVVKTPTTRSRSGPGSNSTINDHAVTPAAASITCAGPNRPGTTNASAAPTGARAAMDSGIAVRGERPVVSTAATAVNTAIAPTATSPDSAPVAAR